MKACGGGRSVAPLILTSALYRVNGQLDASVVLPPGTEPPVRTEEEAGKALDFLEKR